ncbi:Arm DNA-binding domain-containing protein [Hydrogenophaga electricum]|uniref:Integrase DNA-binding domain-containing protein n=1 Tax=Hydrogenophaga electricum TaxID=1230953 RepID=A0ABQ6C187_9BURK|nr:hypothetical protein GCM10007935_07870 [Hydrogenophaga electricum]
MLPRPEKSAVPLVETAIRQTKPGPKPTKLRDGAGLCLLVNPIGSKLWRWKHRYLGKEKLMPLGQCPNVTLAQARQSRDDAHQLPTV